MNAETIEHIIIGIVAALFGGGGLVAWFRIRADNTKTQAEAWVLLVTQLQARVTALENARQARDDKIAAQETTIETLRCEIDELRDQLEAKDAALAALQEKVRILENRRKL